MKFRFPIVIIDEDFRSENTSGLGIRALADALETEGMEVLGVTSYGDLSQFAQQQSRASAFLRRTSSMKLRRFKTAGSKSGPGVNSSSSIDKMNALARDCCCANWLKSP